MLVPKVNSKSHSIKGVTRFVLSLGTVIAIFSSLIFNVEKIVGSKNLLPSSSCTLSLYHLVSTFIGILLTFSPMHFLGFNVMPRRIPDFPDSFHSWNFLSSIGSGITFLSFSMFCPKIWFIIGSTVNILSVESIESRTSGSALLFSCHEISPGTKSIPNHMEPLDPKSFFA